MSFLYIYIYYDKFDLVFTDFNLFYFIICTEFNIFYNIKVMIILKMMSYLYNQKNEKFILKLGQEVKKQKRDLLKLLKKKNKLKKKNNR